MELTPYIQQLRDDLLAAASAGDEESRRAAALLVGAIEPSARLAIMTALSDLASEVTGVLDGTTVELRLDGRDVRVSVTHTDEPSGDDAPEGEWADGWGRWNRDRSRGRHGGWGGRIAPWDAERHGHGGQWRDQASGATGDEAGDRSGAQGEGEDGMSAEDLRQAVTDAGGELSRTTVRLFNELKSQAERAAADQGVSLNTYISRAVQDSVRTPRGPRARGPRPGGRSVTGFIQG